jgi:streptomycin 6-kinase
MQLPEPFIRSLTHVLGERGRAWIDALPALIADCERDYGLTIGAPFELSYNYVAPATLADGTDAVLKLSPHGDDFRHELTATRAFDGHGMVRLLASDEPRGIALLERLRPGTMLVDLDDDAKQTEIAARIMLDLRRDPPPNSGLPTTRDWFEAFARHRAEHGGAGPLPRDAFERGEATYRALLGSPAAPPVLLHGDLHHYNVLSAQRAPWLAIDPHGVIGEPAFEVGAWFGNPAGLLQRAHPEEIIARRVEVFAERLGYDRQRIIAWGLAYQTLSAVWSAENNGTKWRGAIAVAEILASIR